MIKEVIEKINNKSVLVGVIGLGYVGLPMAITMVGKGFDDAKLKHLVNEKKLKASFEITKN